MSTITTNDWITVCAETDLIPDTGLCALHNGEQVAIFRERKTDNVYAVSNYDPIGDANVLSRGIVGSIGEVIAVASPLYKQHFCLQTGACLEEPEHQIKTFEVRKHEGEIQLKAS